MKVPTIATVRIAILIASFASITFIVVLLLVPGVSCLVRPSQVTLVMQAGYQTPTLVGDASRDHDLPQKQGKAAIPGRLGPDPAGPPREATKQKRLWVTFMLGASDGGA
jgi:hypothetical protein